MASSNDNGYSQVLDYMARDYDSILRAMREEIPNKLPEWTDYESESDFGNGLLQLFAHMADILSYYQDRVANESFLATARERRSIINHLQLIGYQLATAAPAATELVLNIPAACTDTVTLYQGDAFATESSKNRPSVRFEYIGEDISIDCSTLAVDATTGLKLYRFPAEEGRYINDDILGVSDGSANQRFSLSYPGLILRSIGASAQVNPDIQIEVELGSIIDTDWTLQEALAFSRAEQKDYTIEIDENDQAYIVLGDGEFGAIPPSGAEIRATYRIGGGTQGNFPIKSINTVVDAPELALIGATVNNEIAATGGSDRESIEHAVAHAPGVFRSLKRSVTKDDYEALALNFQGVGKVRAKATNWNTITLYVAPQGGGYLSDVLKANLRAYFEDKRPLSTIIEFDDVSYVTVYVTANVELQGYYSQVEKKEEIEQVAGELLAFDNLDFAQPIYLSKFYEAIESVEGVEFVTITEFRNDQHNGLTDTPLGKLELASHELASPYENNIYISGIQVIVKGGY